MLRGGLSLWATFFMVMLLRRSSFLALFIVTSAIHCKGVRCDTLF